MLATFQSTDARVENVAANEAAGKVAVPSSKRVFVTTKIERSKKYHEIKCPV